MTPESAGTSSAWRRVRERLGPGPSTALAFAVATALALCVFPEAAPLHPDTARDLLIARECVSGAHCPGSGPPTSFGGLVQGALWSHLLELRWRLGLSLPAFEALLRWSVVAASALVPSLLRASSTRVAAVVTWFVWLRFTNSTCERPLLWNLTPTPLLLALAWWALFRGVDRKSLGAWLLAALALGAAVDCHVLFALLVPCFAFAALVRAPVPGLTAPALVAIPVLLHALDSPGAMRINAALVQPWLAPLLGCAIVVLAAGLALRRRSVHRSPSAIEIASAIAGSYLLALLVLRLVSGHTLEPRYFAPVVGPIAVVAGIAVERGFDRLRPRWPRATQPRVALALGAWLVLDLSITGLVRRRDTHFRTADLEPIAEVLQREGFGFGDLLLGLRAQRAARLVAGVGAFEPEGRRARDAPERAVLVVRTRGSVGAAWGGHSVPVAAGGTAVIVPYAPALRAAEVRACSSRGGAPERCFDARLIDGEPSSRDVGRWLAQSYPGYRALFDGFGRELDHTRIRIRLRLDLAAGDRRRIRALSDREALTWVIDAVEGFSQATPLPAVAIDVGGPAATRGYLWFASEVRDSWQYSGELPAFVELPPALVPAEPWLVQDDD